MVANLNKRTNILIIVHGYCQKRGYSDIENLLTILRIKFNIFIYVLMKNRINRFW